jgi:hypothetical protein
MAVEQKLEQAKESLMAQRWRKIGEQTTRGGGLSCHFQAPGPAAKSRDETFT